MSDVLRRICDDKREHVAQSKQKRSLGELEQAVRTTSAPRGFAAGLAKSVDLGGYGLIAEIKKASPSKGLIREVFHPAALAKAYEKGGASCISVLTDTPYFQGNDEYLVEARSAINLPVLRKDFMVDTYQVTEARALGADCILLIMAALEDGEAAELEEAAFGYGMDVLIEVHDEVELERAHKLKSSLIGVNNRNLKTMEISLDTTRRLAPMVEKGRDLVCESGLFTPQDLKDMSEVGAKRFLIGESLMRQEDVEAATKTLLAQEA